MSCTVLECAHVPNLPLCVIKEDAEAYGALGRGQRSVVRPIRLTPAQRTSCTQNVECWVPTPPPPCLSESYWEGVYLLHLLGIEPRLLLCTARSPVKYHAWAPISPLYCVRSKDYCGDRGEACERRKGHKKLPRKLILVVSDWGYHGGECEDTTIWNVMLCRVVGATNVSGEAGASVFRVRWYESTQRRVAEDRTPDLNFSSFFFSTVRYRRQRLPSHWSSTLWLPQKQEHHTSVSLDMSVQANRDFVCCWLMATQATILLCGSITL